MDHAHILKAGLVPCEGLRGWWAFRGCGNATPFPADPAQVTTLTWWWAFGAEGGVSWDWAGNLWSVTCLQADSARVVTREDAALTPLPPRLVLKQRTECFLTASQHPYTVWIQFISLIQPVFLSTPCSTVRMLGVWHRTKQRDENPCSRGIYILVGGEGPQTTQGSR